MHSPLPLPLVVTSPFGPRVDPNGGGVRHHAGVDLRAPVGGPLRSIEAGRVVDAGSSESAGLYIRILSPEGRRWSYFHLEDALVSEGDDVREGQLIGATGATGRVTGPHLHLELRTPDKPNGPSVDPMPVLLAGLGGAGGGGAGLLVVVAALAAVVLR